MSTSRRPRTSPGRRLAALAAVALAFAGCTGGEAQLDEPAIEAADCTDLAGAYEALAGDLVTAQGAEAPVAEDLRSLDRQEITTTVIVFLDDEALPEVGALLGDIAARDDTWSAFLVDKDAAVEEFRTMFADQPDLIAQVEADPTILPASLRLGVYRDSVDAVVEELETVPGIGEVVSVADRWFDRFVAEAAGALDRAGLDGRMDAIAARADALGCPVPDLARRADFSGLAPGGALGEIIAVVAREGLPSDPIGG